jgi:hypothetical protein
MRTYRLILCLALFCGGCGPGDGPETFHLSGNVTYRGQPLPAGVMVFEPDAQKGNDGPGGFAECRNGKYDTRSSDRGVIGGPYIVRIDGFDGIAANELPMGRTLFTNFETKIELPKADSTYDFVVPDGAR